MTHPSPEMLAELDGQPLEKRHQIALLDRDIVAQSAFVKLVAASAS